jgi:hypothetical protein
MGRLQANSNLSKNNRISIKKQNLGGGKINLSPRVYTYKVTVPPPIGGRPPRPGNPIIYNLRFYDTGLTQNGQPIYYDETKVYWLITVGGDVWLISTIGNVTPAFIKSSGASPVGVYTGSGGYVGSVAISAI